MAGILWPWDGQAEKTALLPPGRQKIPENGRQLFGEAAGFGYEFELPVDVLGIALLAYAYGRDYNDAMFGVNTVDHAMVSKLVFPVAGERAAQRKPIPFRVEGQLFVQDLSELIPHTAVEGFDVRCSV
jgi:hypothetical protein